MSRLLLCALPLVLCSVATAQPDLNTPNLAQPPAGQGGIPLEGVKPDTPAHGVLYFLGALASGNEVDLSLAVSGARIGFAGDDEWNAARRDTYPFNTLSNFKVTSIAVDEQTADSAVVSFVAQRRGRNQEGQIANVGQPQKYTLTLRREQNLDTGLFGRQTDVWRVVPLPVEEVLTKPLLQLPQLQLAATLALRDPRLLPVLRKYRSINQLKLLGLGARQLAEDYGKLFAFDDASRERAVSPYIQKNLSLFVIPGTADEKWHFNDNLRSLPVAQITEPARTVLFYDGEVPTPDKVNFRFGDKTPICFVDGSCKLVAKDELQTLIWKP